MLQKMLCVCAGLMITAMSCAVPAAAAGTVPTVTDVTDLPAKSVVLMDGGSGRILFQQNPDELLPPASITKIMTLLLVFEAIDEGTLHYTDEVICSEHASEMGGSQIWLETGEKMSVEDLIKATAIHSANDAAMALAEQVSGSESAFVERMNQRAQELGMTRTHFVNPTGLDADGHLSTAGEIAIMSRELLRHPDVIRYTTTWMDSLRSGKTGLTNTNRLVRFYEGCTGLKTGTTDGAGSCLAASAERNGVRLIAVTMGSATSEERFASARALLDYGFGAFEPFAPDLSTDELKEISVVHGVSETVPLCFQAPEIILIPKGRSGDVQKILALPDDVQAPIALGQAVGEARFLLDGDPLCTVSVTAAQEVAEMTFFNALWMLFHQVLAF